MGVMRPANTGRFGTYRQIRANPWWICDEGADKDEHSIEYTITVYALGMPFTSLPENDDISVNWDVLTAAMVGKVITRSQINFLN